MIWHALTDDHRSRIIPHMGRHPGMGLGEESLDVYFDSNGRLTGSKIVKH
jgi:hypothetical protein